ncbi:MAG: nucleoside hydrolase [Promicromonosporaceae bacterium]|nr:nucleoside hydrolase [Promicromonosporaceae bacterium]
MSGPGLPTIIDCDPGTDDIAALILARQVQAFDVRAITVTAGNTELAAGLRNALDVTGLLGWEVPVAAGAARPLARDLVTAAEWHGTDGKYGIDIPRSLRQADPRPAWQVIWEEAVAAGEVRRAAVAPSEAAPRKVYAPADSLDDEPAGPHGDVGGLDVIAVGPLTNIATALAAYPDLPRYLRRIVWMGGGVLAGNTTPAAEFNAYVDSEAAERVLHSGVPVWVLPLDVTHECYLTRAELAEVAALGSPATDLWAEVIGRYLDLVEHYSGGRGAALHDPAAVLFAAETAAPGHPSSFTAAACWMGVETQGEASRGMTVTDRYSDKKAAAPNAHLVETVDRPAFIEHLLGLLRRY